MSDLISRQSAVDALNEQIWQCDKALRSFDISMKDEYAVKVERASLVAYKEQLEALPSAQPEQRYTEEELRVFQHGISLSLLSKRSSQHWQYDEDTATEIKFLERLYEKVGADMRGEQNG